MISCLTRSILVTAVACDDGDGGGEGGKDSAGSSDGGGDGAVVSKAG